MAKILVVNERNAHAPNRNTSAQGIPQHYVHRRSSPALIPSHLYTGKKVAPITQRKH